MNATETIVQQIIVPGHRETIEYVHENFVGRERGGKTVKISTLEINRDGSRIVEVTISYGDTSQNRGVPEAYLEKAEDDYRKARNVARLAYETYRAKRDKVTQLRQRRRAYEARQAIDFSSFAEATLANVANRLGLPASLLRESQGSYGAARTGQGDEWSRHRPDPDTGESLAPHEL